ncbi:efflux transporter, RND family, MFP subunit [Glycocaulis alkaliphilus]|uniref:Efflux transporter, RND family, MFP subunit n=1 Tax=Glycocaulis alkaliphilus TaxID=1434191 RepID=A0A3T0E8K0_9PROT|nr:efflux RND transporter periplasmic adaptor subunit [Glycocaulis alkaliphilus]AZU03547.1 efflux transporter, RND family, MFP subunit [Glycocaulis alkaliphilus]GGB74348.1 RND transporter [Glycocaulis alkaliphilus]
MAAAIALTLSACGEGEWFAPASDGPPARFETAVVDRGMIRDIVPAIGRVRPARAVEVGAEINGRVVEVLADFDDRVEEGEVLARIDPQPFEAALVRAQASLQTARASLLEARSRHRGARRELERTQSLAASGTAPQARLEDLEFAAEQFEAAVLRNEAGVSLAEAQLREAQINLERTVIAAPISGFVLERRVEEGQAVNASFSTPVLFVIAANLSEVVIEARVAEADIGRISAGMEVRFNVDSIPRHSFSGEAGPVRRAPQVEGRFVSYLVEIRARDEEERLLPGMTASVEFVAAETFNVLRMPRGALYPIPTQDFVAALDPALLPPDLVERYGGDLAGNWGRVWGAMGGRALGRGFGEGRRIRTIHPVIGDRFGYVLVEVGAEDDHYLEIVEVIHGDLQEGDRVFIFDHGPAGPPQ